MPDSLSVYLAIVLIAALTFGSRLAGPVLMKWMTVSERIERFLDAASLSVIAAIVASMLARSGPREAAAVGAAAIAMLLTRSVVGAMIAGMILAACWSFAVGG